MLSDRPLKVDYTYKCVCQILEKSGIKGYGYDDSAAGVPRSVTLVFRGPKLDENFRVTSTKRYAPVEVNRSSY
jgi:hypothetical protein